MPSENNGDHVEETSAWKEGEQDIFNDEQHGGASDDLDLVHDDAAWPSSGSNPVNGENLENIENDATPHDDDESANELENTAGDLSHGEEAEFSAADGGETKEAADEDSAVADVENTAAADVETEERPSEGPSEGILQDAEHLEQSSEVVDAEQGTDAVDAPSPMDVDVPQPPGGGSAPDAGCDGAMEVEYPTGDEVAGISSTGQLAADSVTEENDQESPMAEDGDGGRQSDHTTSEKVDELADSENITSQTEALDETEFDEVDALQSKTSRRSDLSDNSQGADESGNVDGLVEGDDFTVELQRDTSEQESATSEVDQPATERESAERTATELASAATEESDKASDDVRTTATDTCSSPPPVSSDMVCISS